METRIKVPYVPTPKTVARSMLELAGVKPGEVVVDLGAGEGEIVITAAKEFGAVGIGVEISRSLCERFLRRVLREGLVGKVYVVNEDMFRFDVSIADVVTLYMLTKVNELLRPKLEKELRKGARVVAHDFPVPGWYPKKVKVVEGPFRRHTLYLYVIE